MSLIGLVVAIFIFAALAVKLIQQYWRVLNLRRSTALPPGPTPLPLLGNLGTLLFSKKRPEDILDQWRKDYGSIYTFFNADHPVVVLSDARIWRELYTSPRLADRDSSLLMQNLQKGGILFSSGKQWMERRKMALGAMHSLGLGKKGKHQVTDVVRTCRDKYLRQLRSMEDTDANLSRSMAESIFEIMWTLLFGSLTGMEDPKSRDQMLESFDVFFDAISISHRTRFGDLFPGSQIVQKLMAQFSSTAVDWSKTQSKIQECIENISQSEHRSCFVDFWQSKCSEWDSRELAEVCSEFMVTVVEQTAAFLWILAELNRPRNQSSLLKLRAIGLELTALESQGSFCEQEQKHLRDSALVIFLETLISIGLTPISLGRKTTAELKIPTTPYTIPAGTGVLFLKSALKSESASPLAQITQEESLEERIRKLKSKLFGIGKRHCLGQQLVPVELVEFVLPILCNFELRFDEDQFQTEQGSGLFIKSPAHCRIEQHVQKSFPTRMQRQVSAGG